MAKDQGLPWTVELVVDPDPLLKRSDAVVASADSAILDDCARWTNLAATVVAAIPQTWRVDPFLRIPSSASEAET